MTICKHAGVILLASVAMLCVDSFERARSISLVPDLVSPAYAVVGRPLTPVSVAGTARRTTRRCAADVYDC
jgi:hypothetical protein